MLTCNCALPYTNPDACKYCYKANILPDLRWDLFNDYTTFTRYVVTVDPNPPTYNPETHELVEKKEAKIKRLEKELELLNADVEVFNEVIVETSKEKSKALLKINEINEELKQLK